MIDLHCHVLAGIDDGPQTIEDSLALAQAAVAAGASTLVATPHVSSRYPNAPETIARLVSALNARLQTDGVALEILPGAEIATTRLVDITPAQLRSLGLNGGPWLLVEPPFTATATGLDAVLLDLQRNGHRIVLAHPERCPAFHRDPQMLESLVRAGVLTSITAGALVGHFGKQVRRFALGLAEAEMIHNVASDAHDLDQRRPGITAELEQSGLAPLAQWLTHAVPDAILNGRETMPPRPTSNRSAVKPVSKRAAWRRRRWLKQAS